jgi:hypothetical protein
MINVLGINATQARIVKLLQSGYSYSEVSETLGISEYDVIHNEMTAYSNLSERWSKKESDVRRVLATMLMILLSLMPIMRTAMHIDSHSVDRAIRVRVTSRAKRGKDSFDDELTLMDV